MRTGGSREGTGVTDTGGGSSTAVSALPDFWDDASIRSERGSHCDACFTGDYPLDGTDGKANGKFALERELPLVRA